MFSIRWTFAGRTILNITIGGPDEPEPEAEYRPDASGAGYIPSESSAAAFTQSPATVYLDGRPWPVKYPHDG